MVSRDVPLDVNYFKKHKKVATIKVRIGNSLVVQWLGFRASTAGGMGSNPGWGTRIPHGQKKLG